MDKWHYLLKWVETEAARYSDENFEDEPDEYEVNHKAGIHDGLLMVRRQMKKMKDWKA